VDELVAIRLLYPADYEELWIDDVERRTITQHLDELVAAGRVSEVEPGRFAAA
jgi:hypothetical protein